MSFIGAGLSLAPWNFVSAKSPIQTFALPKPTLHIPHGNFAASELKKQIIPEFELECTVQQFMRNGICECDDDMKFYSFRRDNELLTIGITRQGEAFSEGQLSELNVTVNSFDDTFFSVGKT